jgi:hypothetical protein
MAAKAPLDRRRVTAMCWIDDLLWFAVRFLLVVLVAVNVFL